VILRAARTGRQTSGPDEQAPKGRQRRAARRQEEQPALGSADRKRPIDGDEHGMNRWDGGTNSRTTATHLVPSLL
jgi:hypothetical protein